METDRGASGSFTTRAVNQKARLQLQSCLHALIVTVLRRHPPFRYFQVGLACQPATSLWSTKANPTRFSVLQHSGLSRHRLSLSPHFASSVISPAHSYCRVNTSALSVSESVSELAHTPAVNPDCGGDQEDRNERETRRAVCAVSGAAEPV